MFPQTPHIECVALLERETPREQRGASASPPGLDPEVARPLAARCAELGYDSMWSNDHPARKRPGDAGRVRRRGARRSTSASP